MSNATSRYAVWLILLAAAGTFALNRGTRQTMGLFLADVNTATGLGIYQHQPSPSPSASSGGGSRSRFAGAFADHIGAGRCCPDRHQPRRARHHPDATDDEHGGAHLRDGVLAAGGAGYTGPSVLMAATTRMLLSAGRESGMATGIVNAGGSFGQFVMAPVAASLTAALGWMTSIRRWGADCVLALPAAWVLRSNSRS